MRIAGRWLKKKTYFQSFENGAAMKAGEEMCFAQLGMVNVLQTFFTIEFYSCKIIMLI